MSSIMTTSNPATGKPLPEDAIQRVLFIASKVHVYNIPPLTSTKGYTASTWTADNNKRQIFTARLRIIETAVPDLNGSEKVNTDVVLEDPKEGTLFAAAPYTSAAVVEQVLDSSRFFAVRVVGEGGMKAVLGIGFEQRSEAFDFGTTLQDVAKVLGLDKDNAPGQRKSFGKTQTETKAPAKDYSLKEWQMISVDIGGKGKRPKAPAASDSDALFSIPPPPASTAFSSEDPFLLPPPPSAREARQEKRKSGEYSRSPARSPAPPPSAFDDDFGDFQ